MRCRSERAICVNSSQVGGHPTWQQDAEYPICPECARSFFLPSAGRSMDDDRMQLEPVPLLRENGHVKVALTQ